MTASSPSLAARDSASAGPTVSGLRSPMIPSSIFLPGPLTAERPLMMSQDKRDVESTSPFRLRTVNAVALAGSAVRIETKGVDARRAARSAARNSSVFRIILILLALLDCHADDPLAVCTTRRGDSGGCRGRIRGGLHGGRKRDVVPRPPAEAFQLSNWHRV